jgi:phytoene dehydrogenase-like protein
VGPEREYDVIFVGGGINGLTAACYLQKSGLRGRGVEVIRNIPG